MYEFAVEVIQKTNYKQAKANTFTGLGEVYRELKDFDSAYSYHFASIKILEDTGAKCDLAEAYFQCGLTYQVMGEHDQAEEYKVESLKLFAQIEAPKQIERVNKAFGGNIQ